MLKNQKGSIVFLACIFAAVIVIVFSLALEWYRAFSLAGSIEADIYRAMKTSMDMSILDGYRIDGLSVMDCDNAKRILEAYFCDNMGLNSEKVYLSNGKEIYRLNMIKMDFCGTPPSIYIEGTAEITPMIFDAFSFKINIDISKKLQNVRLEGS